MERDLENGKYFGNYGYVAMHRKLLDNEWLHSNPNRLSLWIHLLLLATHKEKQAVFAGNPVKLKPGQLVTGTKYLERMTGISRSSVQRIMKDFEKHDMIEQRTSNVNRLVSILKWSKYQKGDERMNIGRTSSEHRANNERTSSEQRVNNERSHTIMNNNGDNGNKEKNEKKEEGVSAPSSSFNYDYEPEIKEDYEVWEENTEVPENLMAQKETFTNEIWIPRFLEESSLLPGFCATSKGSTEQSIKKGKTARRNLVFPDYLRTQKTAEEVHRYLLSKHKYIEFDDESKDDPDYRKLWSENRRPYNFATFYREVASKLGHNYKANLEKDAQCFRKTLEPLSKRFPFAPNDYCIRVWMVWYLASLPLGTSAPQGLYITNLGNTFGEFEAAINNIRSNRDIQTWRPPEGLIPE